MPAFLPGLELGRAFFEEAIRPVLAAEFPELEYSAALVGSGSEVLGFDTEMSTDHHWGARGMLFLRDEAHARYAGAIDAALRRLLPITFRGFPTNFRGDDPENKGIRRPEPIAEGPVNHFVQILTIRDFVLGYLGFDVDAPLEAEDWLTFPEQKLRTLVAGAVYHDDVGLGELRTRFSYYPHDVWLFQLASAWGRIGQEEHLMGRAGMVGDEVGSAVIGARLARDLMRLGFLMERQYAPYPKWFGTAFDRLACAASLGPPLRLALAATDWKQRQDHLASAYMSVAGMHNALGLTVPLPVTVRDFFGRPFKVIALHGFADALVARISDPTVRRIAERGLIGGVDLISDSTDILEDARWRPVLRRLYELGGQ
jgi:hypothetical protein